MQPAIPSSYSEVGCNKPVSTKECSDQLLVIRDLYQKF